MITKKNVNNYYYFTSNLHLFIPILLLLLAIVVIYILRKILAKYDTNPLPPLIIGNRRARFRGLYKLGRR